jgi:hypothetical protein
MKGCNRPLRETLKSAVGGEGPGHPPSPPDSSPSGSTQQWTLDLDKRREAALCLVDLICDSQFWKWDCWMGL